MAFTIIFIPILLFISQPLRITDQGKWGSISQQYSLFRENDTRISMYKTAFYTFLKYPVFGIGGPDKFKRSIDDLKKNTIYPTKMYTLLIITCYNFLRHTGFLVGYF